MNTKKIIATASGILVLWFTFENYAIFNRVGRESKKIQEFLIGNKNKSRGIVYNKKSEKRFRGHFEEFLKTPQAIESYKKLIKGLDDDSISTVNKILTRIQKVAKGKYDIYSPDEIKVIRKLKSEFIPIKLGDGCYAYKQYLLPINHFEIPALYHKHFMDQLTTLSDIKNKDIIDVGAYIGDSAIVFSDYTDGKVYSFEPMEENYANMLKTLELNSEKKNIVPVKLGLGAKKEKLTIRGGGSGASVRRPDEGSHSETIEITTLDDYVEEHKLHVGLIKVDIEQMEQDFLKGAENTIRTQRPTLMISIYHNPEDFFNIKPLIESWNLGYKFKIVRAKDTCILNDTMLIAEYSRN
ncbi:MAG: FkbM family methyltransferase [Holosporales bacterium]|jgi:FkbM family methyltransferase|nr:FkbM family methyltransferase [Holosporales bacterium]